MTSDRGSTGEAEMPCDTSPVTTKSPGLNPNATEFLSHNTQTAVSAGAASAGVDGSQWETAGLFNNTDYQYINGDLGDKLDATGTFSPPMSEESPPIPMQETEYTTVYSDNQDAIPGETVAVTDGEVLLDGPIPDEHLRHMLKDQLESYFSRENLSSDTYMQSQMDADQYVPITTVANLGPIHSLTSDTQLILDVLRECNNAQVDEKGEKVRPNHKRCIVILREVPDSTPIEDVEKLFSGEDCPKFVSCEFAHNDNWYVTFDSDAKAQEAYQYLREVVKTFLGKPIMARIKAKPLIRSTYVPRNKHYHQYQFPHHHQQPQHPQPQPTTSQSQQEQEQAQQQQQPQQPQQPFSYSQPFAFMPSVPQYINNQQTIPFYPPPNPLFQTWPTTTTTPMLDPSLVLAMNGYQATSVKLNHHNSGSRHPPFSSMNRNRPQRMHRPNSSQDRNGHDSRFSHERPQSNNSVGNNSHKASPRGAVDSATASSHQSTFHNRRGDNSHPHQKGEDSYSHLVHSSSTMASPSQPGTPSSASQHSHDTNSNNNNNRQSSTETAPQRRSYKSRRRRDEDGVRPSRLNSLHLSSREARNAADQHFDYEPTSFPPLPGSNNNAASGDVFSSKLSDVVKGTAKIPVKDIKSMTITSPTVTTTSNLSPVSTSCTTVPVTAQSTQATLTSTALSTSAASSRNSVSPSLSKSPSVPTSAVPPVALDSHHHHTNSPAHRPAKPTPTPTEGKSVETTLSATNMTSSSAAISSSSFSAASSTQVKGEEKPVRLSYAQMVQKSKPIENCTPNAMAEKSGTDGESNSGSEKGESPHQLANVSKPNHTLKEQSQSTLKTVSTNGRSAPSKDSYRKDSESREQRFSSGRRAKENRMEMRDRRERRRDRERDGRPGTTK